jgi:hypothetical protein
MQVFKHHVIFDEITYDRQRLVNFVNRFIDNTSDFSEWSNQVAEPMGKRRFKTIPLFKCIDTEKIEGKGLLEYPEISELANLFSFDRPLNKRSVDILVYEPGYVFAPHVDFYMYAGIMFPIIPDDGGEPIDFYEKEGLDRQRATGYAKELKESDITYSYKYSTIHPSMFNGLTIHGVRQVQQRRVFLRFKMVDDTFSSVIRKQELGKFIKTPYNALENK